MKKIYYILLLCLWQSGFSQQVLSLVELQAITTAKKPAPSFVPYLVSGRRINIDSIGAAGNGTRNDYPEILTARNAAVAGDEVYCAAGASHNHAVGSNIAWKPGVVFNGNGATLTPLSSCPQADFFTVNASTRYTASTSINVVAGTNTFTYASAASLHVGEMLYLQGAAANPSINEWKAEVVAISGSTVTLSHKAMNSFTATTITQFSANRNITVKNWIFNLQNRTGNAGFRVNWGIGGLVQNVKIIGTPAPVNTLNQGFRILGNDIVLDHCDAPGGKYTDSITAVGYGYNIEGNDNTVQYSKATNWKHGLSMAGVASTNIQFLYDTVSNGNGIMQIVDVHPYNYGTIKGCVVTGNVVCKQLARLRSDSCLVEDNTFTLDNKLGDGVTIGPGAPAIVIAEYATKNITIRNNRIITTTYTTTSSTKAIQYSGNTPGVPFDNMVVFGNEIQGNVRFLGAIGNGHVFANNCLIAESSSFFPFLLYANAIGSITCTGNQFTNGYNNSTNYSIDLGTWNKGGGIVQGNSFYLTNTLNVQPQIKGSTTNLTVTSNSTTHTTTPPDCFATNLDQTAPTVGTLSITAYTQTTISASATAATDASAPITYKWYISTNTYASFSTVEAGATFVSSGTSLSQTFTGLTPGTTYKVYLIARDPAGNESLYNVGSQATVPPSPDASTLTLGTVTSTTIALTIGAATNATSYNAYQSIDGGAFTLIRTSLSAGLVTLPASPGHDYSFYVVAVNNYGQSSPSNTVSTTAPTDGTLPDAPTGVAASNATTTGFTVDWTAVSGATSYNVWYSTSATTGFTSVSASGTSYAFTTLTSGIPYYIQVSAVNGAGEGPRSAVISINTIPQSVRVRMKRNRTL